MLDYYENLNAGDDTLDKWYAKLMITKVRSINMFQSKSKGKNIWLVTFWQDRRGYEFEGVTLKGAIRAAVIGYNNGDSTNRE